MYRKNTCISLRDENVVYDNQIYYIFDILLFVAFNNFTFSVSIEIICPFYFTFSGCVNIFIKSRYVPRHAR